MVPSYNDPLRADSAPALRRTTLALQRVARAVVGDQGMAEDIVQNAWVEALRRSSSSHGFGWLSTLVRSRSIDATRRRAREPRKLDSMHAAELTAPSDDLGEMLEVQKAVLEAVDSLSEPYRTTVYLRYFEDLGPKAIAKRQGLAVKTVKTRLTRAHAQLRGLLVGRFGHGNDPRSMALAIFARSKESVPTLKAFIPTSTLMMKKTLSAAIIVMALLVGWQLLGSAPWALSPASGEGAIEDTVEDPAPGDGVALVAPGTVGADRTVTGETMVEGPVGQPRVLPYGALRVQVVRANGEPAMGVHVIASPKTEGSFDRRSFRRRTDDAGVAFFPKLPVGLVTLRTDRPQADRSSECVIRDGDEAAEEILLADGVRVTGRVLDGGRRPVPGATLWLTARSNRWTVGGEVAEADEHGYFSLEDVPPDQSIGALAGGYLPSKLVDLDRLDGTGSPVQIELILVRGGTSLTGQVTDENGEPIVDALVVAAGKAAPFKMRSDGSVVESWSPRSTRTDHWGRFSIGGLRPGPHHIEARSFEYACWRGHVDLEPGVTTELPIVLHRGATISGRATYPSGAPAPKARLMAFPEPLDELFLQSGQVDYAGALDPPSACTDEDGRYELRQVPRGEVWVYAMEQGSSDGLDGLRRYTKAQLVVEPSGASVWNPVLTDGRVIEGRAFYSDGELIQGVFAILSGHDDETRGARVDDGGFRFTNLGAGPYSIRIQMGARPPGSLEPHAEGILPGGPPIDVVASFPSPKIIAPASVAVKLIDKGQRGKDAARVVVARVDRYGIIDGQAQADRWSFQVPDAGTYRAVALAEKRVIAQGETFAIKGGEALELPDLVTRPGGTLVLRIDRPVDLATEELWAVLRSAPNGNGESIALDDAVTLRLDNMEPGAGVLALYGGGVVQSELAYEVRSGEETVLHVPLVPAVSVPFQVRWPLAESSGTLLVRFIDRSTGRVAHEVDVDDLTQLTSPIRWKALLPLGQYLFEVKKNGAIHASEEFEITGLDPDSAPKLGFD